MSKTDKQNRFDAMMGRSVEAETTRAAKKIPAKPTRKDLERAALAALVRCGVAAVAQAKAQSAYYRWCNSRGFDDAGIVGRVDRARAETHEAGVALTKALRALRGAK